MEHSRTRLAPPPRQTPGPPCPARVFSPYLLVPFPRGSNERSPLTIASPLLADLLRTLVSMLCRPRWAPLLTLGACFLVRADRASCPARARARSPHYRSEEADHHPSQTFRETIEAAIVRSFTLVGPYLRSHPGPAFELRRSSRSSWDSSKTSSTAPRSPKARARLLNPTRRRRMLLAAVTSSSGCGSRFAHVHWRTPAQELTTRNRFGPALELDSSLRSALELLSSPS